MQNHPGFHYYPSLHDNGRVRFPIIDPESDSVASHLARYVTASYLMIHELARELTRARCYLLSTALVFPEEEGMMQQSSVSISLSF